MSKKYAIVTGAANGIGKEISNELSKNNYEVIGIDLAPKPDDLFISKYIKDDLLKMVRNKEIENNCLKKIKRFTNNSPIMLLVNNAAIQLAKPFKEISLKDWNDIYAVNLFAPVMLIKAFIDDLKLTKGSIVNISSIHAHLTKKNFSAYATSKSSLSSLTKSLCLEYGDKVRINAIEPAAIETDMLKEGFLNNQKGFKTLKKYHPSGRIGTAKEVAELVLFLSSNKATFLNGETIGLNGGIIGKLHDPE